MLTDQEILAFADRGFVVLRRVVDAARIATAQAAVDELLERRPPETGQVGPVAYWETAADQPDLMRLIEGVPFAAAERLVGSGMVRIRPQPQVALTIPPYRHRPGGPHIDGAVALPDGRPGTFTMLVGVILSDQTRDDMGNLWVWPGSHRAHQDYFREHGPDALLDDGAHLPIELGEPEQVHGEPGDVLLAHYLLGHNLGGNTSAVVRRTVYFRISHRDHESRWRDVLQDGWLDYPPVRRLLDARSR